MNSDKFALNAAKITACRELFIKYQGKSHKKIEAEMRELGFTDFSRRILYKRTCGRGKREGWIAEFGWDKDWTASILLANTVSCDVTVPEIGNAEGQNQAEDPAGDTGVRKQDACGPDGQSFDDFQTWLKRVSPNMTWDWRHQIYLYEHLKRVTDGDCKRLMIFMPPRHGKSELVTVRYTAWRMRRRPEMKVILASYGQQLANTFSRSIKRVLCDDFALSAPPAVDGGVLADSERSGSQPRNTSFCDACRPTPTERGAVKHRASETPACRFEQTKQTGVCVNCNAELPIVNAPPATASGTDPSRMFPFTSQRPVNTAAQWGTAVGGGLRAVGVGSGVTGFGADLIVIDDPVKSRAQAESERYRERVWEWYNDDLYTRLEPEGSIILIQTRWHEDDLAGRLLKQRDEGGEAWEVVDLPALAEVREKLSEPGAVETAPPLPITQGEDMKTSQNKTVRKADSPPQTLNSEEAGASPPSEPSVATVADGLKIFKPKIIGFPRLYSHLYEYPGNPDAPVAESSPPYKGGEASASADGVVLSAGDVESSVSVEAVVPGSENHPVAKAASVLRREGSFHAGGTGVGKWDACGLVKDPLGREPGDALCPERYDKPKLHEIRTQLGGYTFTSLYQQHPTPADGAIFKKSWLRNIVESGPPGLRWFRGYDLAISTRTTADYTASFRVAVDDRGFMYIADGFRERIEYPEQRRFILERIRSEPGTQHGIEDSAHGRAIVQDLRTDLRMFNYSLKPVRVVGDKLTRALRWSPTAEAGKVKLVRGAWIDAFVNELIRFPLGKHDDQADAVSIAVQMMAGMPDKKMYKF